MNRIIATLASPHRIFTGLVTLASLACASCAAAPPAARVARTETVRTALPSQVQSAIDTLFDDPAAMGETRALLILRDGKPIYEAYGAGYGPDSRLIGWSMSKSVTAALIGLLVADGRLLLDEPAPVPAWQRPGDPRGAITVRHLLHMASGLDHVESGTPVWKADTVSMLFGDDAQDMADMAEGKPPVARPDERFNYSSATTVILSDIIARTLTTSESPAVRRDAVHNFIDGRFAGPLGMTSLTPEFDARGTMIGGSMMHATARDWARFGEFLRARGRSANGQRLLPESWVQFLTTPSPADGGYGGHVWLNRPRPAGARPALWPEAGPADLFAALGHQGQFVIVSPSQRLTIVRLGISIEDTQVPKVRDTLRRISAGL